MSTAVLNSDINEVLKGRKKSFNHFFKIAEKSSDLSITSQAQPMVDERAMAARAVINTPREDREGDIIIPMGVQLENYRKNPVVLWEHGLGEITVPIAKCEDPDGNLALVVDEDQILATSYFSDKTLESAQTFHLIVEGIVRATSVRANPIKSHTRKTSDDEIGLVLEEWELVEWSWGALGVNPDAIAKMIERGTIEGSKIAPCLLKSLSAVAPQRTELFRGVSIPEENTVADENTNPDEEQAKTDTNQEDENTELKTDTIPEDELPADELERMDELMVEEDDASMPLGAKVLRSMIRTYKTLIAEMDAASGPLEQQEVKGLLEEQKEGVEGFLEAIEGIAGKMYKDFGLLDMDEAEEEEIVEAAVKSLKSWLNDGSNQYRLAGIRGRVSKFARHKNLTPAQRTELVSIFKSLDRAEREARNYKSDVSDNRVDELFKQVEALQKVVAQVLPA